ncbi:hypothetical protein E4S40_10680 [Algoriphagus kandeliae]|uniref:Uncharacterized protein n=1 Tax=Algoriphagus kandeliae TaxID=2562278 RepID=A0A4Y9QRP6_9BACT|nr:hypothetical protein [Algoriphagus kandeliae]TFV94478.1 hypothetical protein E4S40_10680 [Algoriphagus kandeliae]
MKYNPLTKKLFTDKGEFIKELHCPFQPDWKKMKVNLKDQTIRNCNFCQHPVLDTSRISDELILEIVQKEPHTCLKIDLDQSNLILSLSIYGV